MHIRRLIQVGLVLAASAPLCAQATPFNTKAGAWKTTVTTTMSGLPKGSMPKISKEQLAKLPPERRAMVEKMMAMQQGKPVKTTTKSCLKKSDTMEKLMANDPNRPNCKRKIVKKTASSMDVEVTCTGQHASHGHIHIKAVSAREVVSTADVKGKSGFKMHVATKSHWVGSSCKGIPHR